MYNTSTTTFIFENQGADTSVGDTISATGDESMFTVSYRGYGLIYKEFKLQNQNLETSIIQKRRDLVNSAYNNYHSSKWKLCSQFVFDILKQNAMSPTNYRLNASTWANLVIDKYFYL